VVSEMSIRNTGMLVPGAARAVTLRTLLATYPVTSALKVGRLHSDAVSFSCGVTLRSTSAKQSARDFRSFK